MNVLSIIQELGGMEAILQDPNTARRKARKMRGVGRSSLDEIRRQLICHCARRIEGALPNLAIGETAVNVLAIQKVVNDLRRISLWW